jgi:chromosome segregation ATPase
VAAVKDNQVAGEAHSAVKGAAMLAGTDDFRRSVLTSVKTTLVALKRDSKPSLAAVTGEHAKAVEVLQQAQARLKAAEVLHGKDVEALKAAEALQLSITSQISAANAQLNAITAELEGLKQSIQSCTNSASDFQAKLNDELRGYITALKKFQALKAAEDAAQAHLKLAEDALHLLQARAAKLQQDEKKAEQAADAAAKKVVPTVPARAPAQVSKATVSK